MLVKLSIYNFIRISRLAISYYRCLILARSWPIAAIHIVEHLVSHSFGANTKLDLCTL